MWKWIGNLASALTLGSYLGAVVVSVCVAAVAWLDGLSPIIVFVIGLVALASVSIILEKSGAWRSKRRFYKETKEIQSWSSWESDRKLLDALQEICTDYANIEVKYFHGPFFRFSERIANAFKLAGWKVNFVKQSQLQVSPIYHGVTIYGPSRILVEGTERALKASGISGTNSWVEKNQVPVGNPKFEHAEQRINIIIGYEE